MALLFLKSIVAPRRAHAYYSLSAATDADIEHCSYVRQRGRSKTPSSRTRQQSEKAHTRAPAKSLVGIARVDPRLVSDATIGLSDGLTVPFALSAGLSAFGDSSIVIYGGLAELIAGAISMGLGGYLGARSEVEAYEASLHSTRQLVEYDIAGASSLIHATFEGYELPHELLRTMTARLSRSPNDMVDFLMRFHHQLPEATSDCTRPYYSALTIAGGYFFGGLIPLIPYFLVPSTGKALYWSMAIMAMALFAFGWIKTLIVGDQAVQSCLKGAVQMVLLGGIAAGAAMGCVKAIGS
ncbi:Protein ccc1 [Elasticomyces elasticus]|nr:Protein ccc1 [Elasticomyces elasticus]